MAMELEPTARGRLGHVPRVLKLDSHGGRELELHSQGHRRRRPRPRSSSPRAPGRQGRGEDFGERRDRIHGQQASCRRLRVCSSPWPITAVVWARGQKKGKEISRRRGWAGRSERSSERGRETGQQREFLLFFRLVGPPCTTCRTLNGDIDRVRFTTHAPNVLLIEGSSLKFGFLTYSDPLSFWWSSNAESASTSRHFKLPSLVENN
ncbi:Protein DETOXIFICATION (Multidrug and toxic compound extrusion protein) [Psidium guajava]|nr:Protein DETOXIFICATION (Multidrug and toxic compound extrusion protein) [Psidium guajava]